MVGRGRMSSSALFVHGVELKFRDRLCTEKMGARIYILSVGVDSDKAM